MGTVESVALPVLGELPVGSDVLGRQQAALLAFGRRTSMPQDVTTLVRDALAFLVDACHVDYGLFAEPSSVTGKLGVTSEVRGPAIRQGSLERAELHAASLAAAVAESGRAILVRDLAGERHANELALQQLGIVTVVVLPLRHFDRSFGVLLLGTVRARDFAPDDLAFVEGVSHLVASGIARATIERVLEEERLIHAEVYDALPQVTLLLDREGRIVSANRASEKLTGQAAGKLAGQFFWNLLDTSDVAAAAGAEWRRPLAPGEKVVQDCWFTTPPDELHRVRWTRSGLPSGRAVLIGEVVDNNGSSAARQPTAAESLWSGSPAAAESSRPPVARQPAEPTAQAPGRNSATAGNNRRRSQRRIFPFYQRVAPYRGKLPAEHEFFQVRCSDISSGGVSFILDQQPEYHEVIIELGQGNRTTRIRAEIVRMVPIEQEGQPVYLLGCQFVERLS